MSKSIDRRTTTPVRSLLWLSAPIAVGAMTASLLGVFAPAVYEAETANWAAQGRGQDAVNLLAYPLLLVLAWRAWRGSLSAFLGWLGVAAYSAYSYLLYAGWVHFGGLFLVYVAVFGLSVYALAGGLAIIDPHRLRAAFDPSVPHCGVGTTLTVLGGLFAVLWLSEIVPSLLDGTVPQTVAETGLASNPVWLLDLAIVLPAMVLAGVLLRRSRPLGYLLAVPLLVFGMVMGAAIVGMSVSLAVAGEAVTIVPSIMMGLVVIFETLALRGLLRHLPTGTTPVAVVRGATSAAPPAPRTSAARRPIGAASR